MTAPLTKRIHRDFGALIEPGSRVLVCLSGGLDSTLLLTELVSWARPQAIEVSSIHVHHGLREGADHDAHVCHTLAHALGCATHHTAYLTVPKRDSVQQQARQGRYAQVALLARHLGVPQILTAHHQDDVLETLTINLTRGSGLRGLVALHAPRAPFPLDGFGDLQLVRPLLGFSKAELLAHATKTSLCWKEDPTNAQTHAYTRNALRHGPLAALAQEKTWRSGMVQTLETLGGQWEALWTLAHAAYDDALIALSPTSLVLGRHALTCHPQALCHAVFQRAHDALRIQKPWHAKHFHLLTKSLQHPGATHLVLPGARLDLEMGHVRLWRTSAQGRREHDGMHPEPVGFQADQENAVPWFFGSFQPASLTDPVSLLSAMLNPKKAYTVRAGTTPKLTERLRELGVPRSWRPWWPHVHEAGCDEVVWVPGMRSEKGSGRSWEFCLPAWIKHVVLPH